MAACLAGAISLESAAALVASRGAADVPVAAPAWRLVVGASSFEPGADAADVLRACRVEAASSGGHDATSALRSSCDAAIDVGFDDGATGVSSADAFVLAPRLGPDGDTRRAILEAIAALYVRGASIDWNAVDGGLGRRGRAPPPGHPFERRRCWLDPSELAPLRSPTCASDTRDITHTKEPA